MKKILVGIFMLLTTTAWSQNTLTNEAIMQKVATGRPFILVLLSPGDEPEQDSVTMSNLHMEHLRSLFTLEKDGKISIFGPIINGDHLSGIIIFNNPDRKAAIADLEADPYIAAGHLNYEIYDLFTIPGQKIPE